MPQKSMWPKASSPLGKAFVRATILAVALAGLILAAIWVPDWRVMRSSNNHNLFTDNPRERRRQAENLVPE